MDESIQVMDQNANSIGENVKEYIWKYVKDLVKKNITMGMWRASNPRDNFLGFISKVTIRGTNEDGTKKVMYWVVKTAPQSPIYRSMFNTKLAYAREAFIYERVLPIFKEFQIEKGASEPFNQYANFVASYLKPFNENLIMEDLKSVGYLMRNPQKPLDLSHVKLVMIAYAKLHALSYALRDQKPELFEWLASNTEDVFGKFMKNESKEDIMNKAIKSLDPEKDSEVVPIFEEYSKTYIEIRIQKRLDINQYSVIGHGDSWVNNMLWKYEDPEKPTYPTKVCLLDWQLSRYCSPACDLSYFLFTCTSKQFRDKHYEQMIKFYYYTLCEHLMELGSDPERCLPFHALQEELRKFSIVGLYMTILVLDVITKYSCNHADNKDDFEVETITESSDAERCTQRVRDVIIDFYEKGYFNYQ